MKHIFPLLLLALMVVGTQAGAQEGDQRASFQSYKTVGPFNIVVPTVVSVPMEGNLYSSDEFLVRDSGSAALIGSLFQKEYSKEEVVYRAVATPSVHTVSNLVDKNLRTFVQFDVAETGQNQVSITLQSDTPYPASKLYTQLSAHVSLPLTVSVMADSGGAMKTVVAQKRMTSSVVTFPETVSDTWVITFTYAQPLRIAEMILQSDTSLQTMTQDLRFLAHPGSTYDVFFNADQAVSAVTSEPGYLADDAGVLVLSPVPTAANPYYTPADVDADGVRDVLDNCVNTENTSQEDIDANGRGDACDDFDRDGRLNSVDNCPDEPNRSQVDEDGDGIGDVCDDEESRFTEQNPWIPWVGMGIAVAVLIVLFALVVMNTKKEEAVLVEEDENEGEDTPQ